MSSLFDFEQTPDHYGVMGNPIAHSKSPQIHQAFAKQTKQLIIYEAILVDIGGFPQAVGNFTANGGKGLNVTVPFKRDAWKLADDLSERAKLAGAVNTLSFADDNSLFGDNTDGIGLVNDLIQNHQQTLKNRSILLIGAGGAARGVIGPLLEQQPSQIFIANRTPDKAYELANEFSSLGNIQGGDFRAIPNQAFDLLINATSASLQGKVPPLPSSTIAAESFCYDMMYAAQPTAFMTWAKETGTGHRSDGLGMLVEQAAESFNLWRGIRPKTQPVIELIRKSIT